MRLAMSILEGHTYEYLAIGKRTIKPTTFWPEGTTPNDIKKYLEEALMNIAAEGNIPTKRAKVETHIKIKSGHQIEVTVGAEIYQENNNFIINSFHPNRNPTLTTYSKVRLTAIAGLFADLPLLN